MIKGVIKYTVKEVTHEGIRDYKVWDGYDSHDYPYENLYFDTPEQALAKITEREELYEGLVILMVATRA